MQPVRWTEVNPEPISDEVTRQVVWGEKSTCARITLKTGAHVSRHKHESEQMTLMMSGSMRMNLSGQEIILRAGDILVIPPNAEHEVWALENAVVLDFFAPGRDDWKAGKHDHLAGR